MEQQHDASNFKNFEQTFQSHDLEILKAALPYFNWNVQKYLGIFIKYMEFQKATDLLKTPNPIFQTCDIKDPMEKFNKMMQDIKSVCSDKEREELESLTNMFDMLQTYQSMMM